MADDAIAAFFGRGGTASLTVGLDAVTNRATLERLQEYQRRYPALTPTVFWNPAPGLFHPKLSFFRYPDNSDTLIVGSGNLTPGGMAGNFEAFTVIAASEGEVLDSTDLDDFIARHAGNIRPIDQEALERAARNIFQRAKQGPRVVPAEGLDDAAPSPSETGPEGEGVEPPAATASDPVPGVEPDPARLPHAQLRRVLVAQVPKAGRRWRQAHFNDAVVAIYFRVRDLAHQRAFLTYVYPDGRRGPEHPRRVVYSLSNKNYKIEIENPGERPYPAEDRPILIFVENAVRTFEYLLLMPGDPGYDRMLRLTLDRPSVGRGLPRVITTAKDLARIWPQSPLLLPMI